MKKLKIGLVLSGGGSHGIAHTEVLKIFDKLKIKPYAISGASAGALIGAFYANGYSGQEIQDIFLKLKFVDFLKILKPSLGKGGLIKNKGVCEFINKNLKNKRIEDSKIKFFISVTDLIKQKDKIISKGSISKHISASIAIPGVFEPVQIGDSYFVDGGISNPLPIEPLKKICDVVIAIDVSESKIIDHEKKIKMMNCVVSSFEYLREKELSRIVDYFKPDIFYRYNLKKYSILDFHKLQKVLDTSIKQTPKLEKEIIKLIEKKKYGIMRRMLNKIIN